MPTKPAPVYFILHGKDEYSIRQRVNKLRADFETDSGDADLTRFEGTSTPMRDVLAAALSMPFLSDKRLVIAENILSWNARRGAGKAGKAELDALEKALPQLPATTRLVFVEYDKLENTHPIMQKALLSPDRAYVKEFTVLTGADLIKWITKTVEGLGGTIEPRAAGLLASVVGDDLRAAESECFKLVVYTGGERAISEADIGLLTPYTADTVIWDLIDALGSRDGELASRLLSTTLADPKQEVFGLFALIIRQFRILLQVREVLDAGGNVAMLPDLARLYDKQRAKFITQARQFTIEDLEIIYRRLLKMDFDFKDGGSAIAGREGESMLLELFIAAVTG